TYGVESTSDSPRPLPSRTSQGPVVGPNSLARLAMSAAASCLTVVMSRAASLATVFAPIPQIASGGRSPSTSNQVSVVSRATPAGLAKPVAILACSLLSPMPTEQSRSVAAFTSAASPLAKLSGSSVSTPTNASSQPRTSTGQPVSCSTAITRVDTSLYASASTGRNTQSGQRFAAVRSGRPECTPNSRAS